MCKHGKHLKQRSKFVKYMRKTRYNKLVALALFALAGLSVAVLQDGTMLLFATVIGLPLFFTKHKWVEF